MLSLHTTFVRSNKSLSFSQAPKVSSSKVTIIEEESPQKNGNVSGYHIYWCQYTEWHFYWVFMPQVWA